MSRREKTILAIGSVCILATIALELLMIENRTGIVPVCMIMIPLSEVIFFGGLFVTERVAETTQQIIYRSINYFAFSAFLLSEFVSCVLFMGEYRNETKKFWIIQIILLVVLSILIIISFSASKAVSKSNVETMSTTSAMRDIISKLEIAGEENDSIKNDLRAIADELKFSDLSIKTKLDDRISSLVDQLIDTKKNSEQRKIIDEIKESLAERKIVVSNRKRGSI